MLARVYSSAIHGVDGLLIEVEVDIALGLPVFATVGLPDGAVRESKDRVKAAVKNSGYEFPNRRITVNLAPADVKKAGSGYDLPIALGILAAAGTLQSERLDSCCIIGELSLDGAVRPTPGILPMVLAARNNGLARVLVPAANLAEALVVQDLEIHGVQSLAEAVEFLAGLGPVMASATTGGTETLASDYQVDFAEVKGQAHAKRALEIAAAGGHNLLMCGPPGTGKTMLAQRLATILPPLSFEEALETTKIYSVLGMLPTEDGLIACRPFRAPHHTISDAGLIGGGQHPRPGEVSLAHNGVLFLDELPEFKKNVLEVLRQPLENGLVTIARASQSLTFPARFMLVAAMNPCPCGYYPGDMAHECTCSPVQVQRYRQRLSGPLLDRIDLQLEVAPVPYQELTETGTGETSARIRERVVRARTLQQQRFAGEDDQRPIACNSRIRPGQIPRYCGLDREGNHLLEQAMHRFAFSARSYHRLLKLARTIADLAASEQIRAEHLAEAIQYRRLGEMTRR